METNRIVATPPALNERDVVINRPYRPHALEARVP
jgi:hypothetical protein